MYMDGINRFFYRFHDLAREKGWWPRVSAKYVEDKIGEKIALIHSELSEALEEFRNGKMSFYYEEGGKPGGFGIELADAIIRIGDLFEACRNAGLVDSGMTLPELINVKHKFNEGRSFRHGGKKA